MKSKREKIIRTIVGGTALTLFFGTLVFVDSYTDVKREASNGLMLFVLGAIWMYVLGYAWATREPKKK